MESSSLWTACRVPALKKGTRKDFNEKAIVILNNFIVNMSINKKLW